MYKNKPKESEGKTFWAKEVVRRGRGAKYTAEYQYHNFPSLSAMRFWVSQSNKRRPVTIGVDDPYYRVYKAPVIHD